MMKICHITTVHTPFDGRIFHKECKSLAKRDYDVYLIAPYEKDETVDGIHLRAIKLIHNPYKRILISPVRALFKALSTKSRIYHLHDPELLFLGVVLSILGKKVIFDSHENVGEQILTKEWIPSHIIRRFVSFLYGLVEKLCLLFFTGVIAVNEDIRQRFAFKKRVEILRNYPILKDINQVHSEEVPKPHNMIVIYAGGLTSIRGIRELILAMKDVDARLWLMGPWESESFRSECESLQSWNKCDYLGIIPFGKQYDYLRAADIGMVTLYPEKNYLKSLPVKAFEYMACGLALVMSNFEYWQNFFRGHALFVDPYQPEDIAAEINILIHDKALMNKMSRYGIEKVNKEYSWEEESKKLLNFYAMLRSSS
ncbi:MAG: glycosyltransferase [Bacteroidota bacterium]